MRIKEAQRCTGQRWREVFGKQVFGVKVGASRMGGIWMGRKNHRKKGEEPKSRVLRGGEDPVLFGAEITCWK